jgi:hypothetical protein
MRQTSDLFATLLRYSHQRVTRIDAYYDGVLTMANVPFVDGVLSDDDSAVVKRELTLNVPVRTPLARLDPGSDETHPLNCYGQMLRVHTGIMMPGPPDQRAPELLAQGWYLITDWQRNDDEKTLNLSAQDLSARIVDDHFYSPEAPPPAATYASEFTRLIGGSLPAVHIDAGLIDRPLNSPSVVWDRDRVAALNELCDAWPARWYVDDAGRGVAAPPYAPVTSDSVQVVTFTDGSAGTITTRARANQRTRVYNAAIVTGALGQNGAAAPRAILEVTDPSSPIAVGGPFGRRPRFHNSDLIQTQAQADATAAMLIGRYTRFGRAEAIGLIPDPRVELGDIARVYTADGDAYLGRVTKRTLPLIARQGGMSVTVSTLPAGEAGRARAMQQHRK